MPPSVSAPRRGNPQGWRNVAVGFIGMALSYPMFTVFVFGTLIAPLEAEFGWRRGDISFALTMTNIGVIIASPLLGLLIDRYGVRRILIPSLLSMGLAVAAVSLLGADIRGFYLLYFLIPLLGAGTLPQSYSRVIIAWFVRRRGLALGLTLSGFGVGAMLAPIFMQYMIAQHDWRLAYILFSVAIFFIALPLALGVLKESPAEMGLRADGGAQTRPEELRLSQADFGLTLRQAARGGTFWLILFSFLLVGVGITAVLAHLVPLLIGRGVAPATAALCMTSLGLGLIVGRILAGYLMDRFFAPWVAAVFLLGLLAAILILASGHSGWLIFPAAALAGLATGSEIGEIAYICGRYFGPRAFGKIYGLMFAAFQAGSALGAPLLGFYYQRSGEYTGALWVVAGIVAVGIVLIAALGPYPPPDDKPRLNA